MATFSTFVLRSQSNRLNKSAVVVEKVRVSSCARPRAPKRRMHAITDFLCTSRPAQHSYKACMGTPPEKMPREVPCRTATLNTLFCVLHVGRPTIGNKCGFVSRSQARLHRAFATARLKNRLDQGTFSRIGSPQYTEPLLFHAFG